MLSSPPTKIYFHRFSPSLSFEWWDDDVELVSSMTHEEAFSNRIIKSQSNRAAAGCFECAGKALSAYLSTAWNNVKGEHQKLLTLSMSCWLLWRKISIDLCFLSDFSLPARCRRHEAFLLLSLSPARFCVIAGSKWAHDVFETTCIRLYLMLMRWDETFTASCCSCTVVPPHVAWVEAFSERYFSIWVRWLYQFV